jgi:hypothetical protein
MSGQNLRSTAHRTVEYGYAAVLSFNQNCTILQKPCCLADAKAIQIEKCRENCY